MKRVFLVEQKFDWVRFSGFGKTCLTTIPFVLVYIDQYVSNLLRRDMLSRYVLFLSNVFKDCKWPVAAADIPIKVRVDRIICLDKRALYRRCFRTLVNGASSVFIVFPAGGRDLRRQQSEFRTFHGAGHHITVS